MPLLVSELARRFHFDETRERAELTMPMLVWEKPPSDKHSSLLLGTSAEQSHGRPISEQALAFKLEKGKAMAFPMGITVGRAENNDIILEDHSVSRFHAFFQQDLATKAWKLVDAESKVGTWAGPLRLAPSQPQRLQPTTKLRFGALELTYLEPATFFEYLQGRSKA